MIAWLVDAVTFVDLKRVALAAATVAGVAIVSVALYFEPFIDWEDEPVEEAKCLNVNRSAPEYQAEHLGCFHYSW